MCDTLLIVKGKNRYFLKNSDRSPNEPNLCVYIPHQLHDEKELQATYITIPQVKETYECFLVKPSWIWGAEMGYNEYGVAIGNEAVFTKTKEKKPSLIGMDYLRLGLERAKSAKEALEVITTLLKVYGQGGNCGYDHEFYYNNSYLIADANETYVLETVGKDYAYKKVEGNYNISNKLSLDKDYDFATKDYKKGFSQENSDFIFTLGSMSKIREKQGKELSIKANDSILDMIDVLSYVRNKKAIYEGDTGSICMVKNALGDHSTGSMIVNLSQKDPTIWVSGGTLPALAVYKPYYLGMKDSFIDERPLLQSFYFYKRSMIDRVIGSKLASLDKHLELRNSLNKEFVLEENKLREENSSRSLFEEYARKAYNKEEEFVKTYDLIVNTHLRSNLKYSPKWQKLCNKLSLNPFSVNLDERIRKHQ